MERSAEKRHHEKGQSMNQLMPSPDNSWKYIFGKNPVIYLLHTSPLSTSRNPLPRLSCVGNILIDSFPRVLELVLNWVPRDNRQ